MSLLLRAATLRPALSQESVSGVCRRAKQMFHQFSMRRGQVCRFAALDAFTCRPLAWQSAIRHSHAERLLSRTSASGQPATSAILGKRPLTASLRAYSFVPVRAYELAGEWAKRPLWIDLTLAAPRPGAPT